MKGIKFIIAILMYLIQISIMKDKNTYSATDTHIQTGHPGEEVGDNIGEFILPCHELNCILYKCCPLGQCLQLDQCVSCDTVLNFSTLNIYDKNIVNTGKTVSEVFRIVPKIFGNKTKLEDYTNVLLMEYNAYILKNGKLKLETPNVYNRWTTIERDHFCIDFFLPEDDLSKTPQILAIIENEVYIENPIALTAITLVSCVFLFLVLVVYILLPELQNLYGKILMAFVTSLLMAFLLLSTIQLDRYEDNVCIGLTMAIYYCTLATFCWMSVMSYDIWRTFRVRLRAKYTHRRGECFKFFMYCLYAWGLPLLMTIGFFILNTVDMRHIPGFVTPNVPQLGCFLKGGQKLLYLYVPMLILIAFNWMFYLMTAFNVWRLSRGTAVLDSADAGTPAAHRTQRNRLIVYLKLSVVMGVNWLFEIISFALPGFKGWYITDAYNLLIGFFIFLIFVCKKNVYRRLYKRFTLIKSRRFSTYQDESSDSSSEMVTLQICTNPKGING